MIMIMIIIIIMIMIMILIMIMIIIMNIIMIMIMIKDVLMNMIMTDRPTQCWVMISKWWHCGCCHRIIWNIVENITTHRESLIPRVLFLFFIFLMYLVFYLAGNLLIVPV